MRIAIVVLLMGCGAGPANAHPPPRTGSDVEPAAPPAHTVERSAPHDVDAGTAAVAEDAGATDAPSGASASPPIAPSPDAWVANPLLYRGDLPWADGVTDRPCEVRKYAGRRLEAMTHFTYDGSGRVTSSVWTGREHGERRGVEQQSTFYEWDGDLLVREYQASGEAFAVAQPEYLRRGEPWVRYTYLPSGRLVEAAARDGTRRFSWEGARPTEMVLRRSGATFRTTTFRYDDAGHVIERTKTLRGGDALVDHYTWDGDRLVAATLAGDRSSTMVWDEAGRLVEVRGYRAMHLRYDHDGRLIERSHETGTNITREVLSYSDHCPDVTTQAATDALTGL